MTEQEPSRPVLRVVRGNPDDAELGALTAVLAASASGEKNPAQQPQRSRWADHAGNLSPPPRPGPGAWRASGLPS